LKKICKRVDSGRSAIERKKGSGRPRTARTADNIEQVELLICSQGEKPGTHSSTREIAANLGICHASVYNIAKNDLGLSSFKRIPGQVLTDATREKRLTRSKQLLRRYTVPQTKNIFFTDEKAFYLDPPVNRGQLWSAGRKKDVDPQRLIKQRAKFSRSVMVSAGVCYSGKGRLHFVDERAKVNALYYTGQLLPKLTEDCRTLMGNDFTFQQDGAPAHSARQAQDWLQHNCPNFIRKDEWPPNSPDLNPLDFCVWGMMLDKYEKHTPRPTKLCELKIVLQTIWNELPQNALQKAVLSFRKRLRACIRSDGGHFEHLLS
jgi:transposase